MRKALLILFFAAACAPAGPATKPNDREWSLLTADYQWIQTLRASQKAVPAGATRKQQIEIVLENQQKIVTAYQAFIDKVDEYYGRTSDPRAASLMAKEKILLGDEYLNILSRYEKALEMYRK